MSVVVVSGGFDPLHAGHIEYIKRARKYGSSLIAIVNSDKFLDDKKGYHVMNWKDRLIIVGELKDVDIVFPAIDIDNTVCETLRFIRAEYPGEHIVFAKGGDRWKEEIPEADVCKECLIEVVDGLGCKIRSSQEVINELRRNIETRVLPGVR